MHSPFGLYCEVELDQSTFDLLRHGAAVRILVSGACLSYEDGPTCEDLPQNNDLPRADVFQEAYQRYNAQGLIYRPSCTDTPLLNHTLDGPPCQADINEQPRQVDQSIEPQLSDAIPYSPHSDDEAPIYIKQEPKSPS